VTNMATRLMIASFDHGGLGLNAGSVCVPSAVSVFLLNNVLKDRTVCIHDWALDR
jgi:hypothetical protein